MQFAFGLHIHITGRVEISLVGVVWPFSKVHAFNRFRDDEMKIRITLPVGMTNHIHGHAIHRNSHICTVINIEST
jgi:hypothetical protein